jgi:hypothetical protein
MAGEWSALAVQIRYLLYILTRHAVSNMERVNSDSIYIN